MEGEISVQQTPCAVIQCELTAQALRQSELTAKARSEACAAKTKGREEGSPLEASSLTLQCSGVRYREFHVDGVGEMLLLQRTR